MTSIPQDEPEPTRPTWSMLFVALALGAVIAIGYHWHDISAYAHIPELKQSLGLG